MSFKVCLHVLFVTAFFVCGCSKSVKNDSHSNNDSIGKNKIQVVATVGMVADLVSQVGREHVQITQMMGDGVDPHLYQSTRDDVRLLMLADIVFYSGLNLEGKMTDTLIKMGREKPVVGITSELSENYLLHPEGGHGHPDPHVWMDVAAWAECLDVIVATLSKQAPEFESEFKKNAAEYKVELMKLDHYGKQSIKTIPEASRLLITSHDAFNYFGRAYHLQVKGVQGISTESEAGLLHVNQLVDEIVSKKIGAIFVESSVSQKSIEAILEGVRIKGHNITIGGVLFSDAMGERDTYEGTYTGMLDHNITLVTRGLGGQCPERGMNGKLAGSQHVE